ncbi:MAG TPA: helix-hairpin-helix domain-containing protein [Saprospiraceae bacterium]|nr:helix-hairpin-helix domain-containing protein [Saprospiraceae bacterium]HMQ81706.1 helix-hairpin-helix domain-containing protein [Saprospiraceae bacterium]
MDINQLFDQFNSKDSYAILFIMLIAFLFGLLLGYILRGRRVAQLRQELNEKMKQITILQAELEGFKEQLSFREADLKKAEFAAQEAEAKTDRLEADKAKLFKDIYTLNREIEQLQSSNKTHLLAIDELTQQLQGLENQNIQLSEAAMQTEDDTVDNVAQMQSLYNATRNRLEDLEAKMNQIIAQNELLKEEIKGVKKQSTQVVADSVVVLAEVDDDEKGSSAPVADANKEAKEQDVLINPEKQILVQKIGVEDAPLKDNLTRINGIGPFIEKKLNDQGIYTYEQIAAWGQEKIQWITKSIAYFDGRIERDGWVTQAAQLAQQKRQNPDAFLTSIHPTDQEDLKIVEGIGPKIEGLLKEAGILNWSDLAEAPVEQLEAILDAAGPNFRIHNPSTWPTQAKLAQSGEWNLLREYQTELIGGRDIS